MENFEEFHNSILKSLQFLRKKNGYTLEQVGKYLGISKSGYRKIERGESQISLRQLHILSLVYEVSMQKILFGKLYLTITS